MRVRIDRFVEDSNVFEDVNDPLTARQRFTVGHRVRVISENVSVIVRIDHISRNHGIVDLPEKQAKKLIELGKAHEPTEQDERDNEIIWNRLEIAAIDILRQRGKMQSLVSGLFSSTEDNSESFEKMKKDLAQSLKKLMSEE